MEQRSRDTAMSLDPAQISWQCQENSFFIIINETVLPKRQVDTTILKPEKNDSGKEQFRNQTSNKQCGEKVRGQSYACHQPIYSQKKL